MCQSGSKGIDKIVADFTGVHPEASKRQVEKKIQARYLFSWPLVVAFGGERYVLAISHVPFAGRYGWPLLLWLRQKICRQYMVILLAVVVAVGAGKIRARYLLSTVAAVAVQARYLFAGRYCRAWRESQSMLGSAALDTSETPVLETLLMLWYVRLYPKGCNKIGRMPAIAVNKTGFLRPTKKQKRENERRNKPQKTEIWKAKKRKQTKRTTSRQNEASPRFVAY